MATPEPALALAVEAGSVLADGWLSSRFNASVIRADLQRLYVIGAPAGSADSSALSAMNAAA